MSSGADPSSALEVRDVEPAVVTKEMTLTVSNVVDCFSGALAPTVCSKSSATYLVAFISAALDMWGRSGKIVLRADQEVSLTMVMEEIKSKRQAETLIERSAVTSHQSVGTIERANRELASQLRAMRIALEDRLVCRVPTSCDIELGCWADFE